MLDLQPRLLAVAAGVVLLGGVGAAATVGDDASDPPGSTATATDGPTPTDEASPDDGAGADVASSSDDAVSEGSKGGKGGTAGTRSTTERTLEGMLERDLSDAVRTYQDAGRRDDG